MITSTIGEILEKITQQHPHNDAVVYPGKIRLSYEQFNTQVNTLAKALMAIGIQKGDHIAIWANNVPEWIFLQFASAKIGAILVTINTYYKAGELSYLLKHADITTLFIINSFKDVNYQNIIRSLLSPSTQHHAQFPLLKHIIFVGEHPPSDFLTFNQLLQYHTHISDTTLQERQQSLDTHDVINMQYTSGTTGHPKGVMLTHYNILNNAKTVGSNLGLTYRDRMCIPVPFFHCFGCVLSTLNCVLHGATMIPIETFNAEEVLQTIHQEHCTILQGVPTMFINELHHPNFKNYDLTSLRTGIMAGAPCPQEIMRQVIDQMHMHEITICYGLTETSPVLTQTNRNDTLEKRVKTVGKPLTNIEIHIINPLTGKIQPPNTPGELIASGYNIMKGYYKMPDQTNQTIKDGWIRTKDLAIKDEEGYIRILGRIDDMIIRGGENVYPREIEEFLYTNEKIKEVAIVGVPNPTYGEEVFAFIQLKDGMTAVADEIKDFCIDKISRFKIPKYIQFLDEYPMTASGKIQKYRLRELAQKQLSHQQPKICPE